MKNKESFTGKPYPDWDTLVNELHQKYHTGLILFVHSKIKDKGLSEDIVAETFMRFCDALPRFPHWLQAPDEATKYLFTIARNCCITHVSKKKHKYTDYACRIKDPMDDGVEDIHRALYKKDTVKYLRTLIDKLPQSLSIIARLSFIEDLTPKEVALKLGRTPESINVDKSRAIKKLKGLLQKNKVRLPPDTLLLALFLIDPIIN